MNTIIPQGYRITVVSWENDADNYKTCVMEGLLENEAKFIISICRLLIKSWHSPGRNYFGNMYEPSDNHIDKFCLAVEKIISSLHDPMYKTFDEVFDYILLELGLGGTDFYTRVCESIKVEYVEKPIEIFDVTDQFLK